MASAREDFRLSGPLHLTTVDWINEHYRRSVVASLVQGVNIMERDRQKKREGCQALAPPWWEFFHFKMLCLLKDDFSIFGAIYEFKPSPASNSNLSTGRIPRYVIAFRGTLTKSDSFMRDLEMDIHIIRNSLHLTSRFEIAIQAVRKMVASVGGSNVWLAGHSLGAAMALLAGKTIAKTGVFLKSFLFNSPFLSVPIERIKHKKVKHGIRIAASVIRAGLVVAMEETDHNNQSADPFLALSAWVPYLYVNPADYLCLEYIGYFDHRKKMEEKGLGGIERLATQHSIRGWFMKSEPIHLIPSANLTVNLTPCHSFKQAHGIHQWWSPDLHLESKLYTYK